YDDQLAPIDGTSDLSVVSVAKDGNYAIAIIVGRSDRELESPFFFSQVETNMGPSPVLPSQIAIGEYTGDTHLDIAAVAAKLIGDTSPALWIAKSTGAAELTTMPPAAGQMLPSGYDFTRATLRAMDGATGGSDALAAIVPQTGGAVVARVPHALVTAQVQ